MNTTSRVQKSMSKGQSQLLGLLVFLAPFCLYFNTMAPTVYGLDSAELTTGAYTLGIVHSPGSPLYLLVGRLFCFLPFGDVGWRMNLMSVVTGSLSAFFIYATVLRLTGRAWIGVVTAWLLAASYYIWVWNIVAELYSPHLCIVSALIWLIIKWRATHHDGLLWATGILAGLGAGNHTALVLVGPSLAWLVFTSDPTLWRQPGRFLGPGLACLCAFIAIFLYMPIRSAAHPSLDYVRDYFPQVNLLTIKGVIWMIRGGMFESMFFNVTLNEIGRHLFRLGTQLLANFGFLATAVGLLGLVSGLTGSRERRHFTLSCLLMFLFHSGFYVTYGASDIEWMYSVSYLILAFFFCIGLSTLADRLSVSTSPGGNLSGIALKLLAGAMVLSLSWFNYPYLDLSRDHSARVEGEHIFASLGPQALFIGMWEHEPILNYLQLVDGLRPDVHVINGVFTGPLGAQQLACDAHHDGHPVYTTYPNLFSQDFTLSPFKGGICYRVLPNEIPPHQKLIDR